MSVHCSWELGFKKPKTILLCPSPCLKILKSIVYKELITSFYIFYHFVDQNLTKKLLYFSYIKAFFYFYRRFFINVQQ